MKKLSVLLLVLLLLSLCGCKGNYDVAGNRYLYEHDGFGSEFMITFNEDGTFSYYEGMLSSYLGTGTWTIDDNGVLTMTDDAEIGYSFVNHFLVEKDRLIFIEEDSSNFLYLKVAGGDAFLLVTE